MAANYNRPKPIDPIWYRRRCFLHITCRCGRSRTEQLGSFCDRNRVRPSLRLYQLIARLRCSCGERPFAVVTRDQYR